MVSIQVPKSFAGAYERFMKGEYSKMYDAESLKVLFSSPERSGELAVLTKSEKAFVKHQTKVQEEFGEGIEADKDGEYDLPPKRKEEIFNCENPSKIFV